MSQFVATTTLSQMRSLGTAAERSLQRLQVVLSSEFPGGIGLELAEPVPRKDGSGIDWYTDHDGSLTRLVDLPADAAAACKAHLYQAVQSVLQAASVHDAKGDPAARSTAAALRNAVTFAGDENVWIAGGTGAGDGTIILTAWGYEKHYIETSGKGEIVAHAKQRVPPGMAVGDPEPTRVAAAAAAAIPVGEAPPERIFLWRPVAASLLFLVPLAMALLTAWLFLPACGIRLPFGSVAFGKGDGAFCEFATPRPAARDSANLMTRELLAEAAVLEEELRRRMITCQPPAPITSAPVPDPTDEAAIDQAEDLLAKEGVVLPAQESAVTLTWDGKSDLDLQLTCPNGSAVNFRGDACGAEHDLDLNVKGDRDHSVEIITWKGRQPTPGRYEVWVANYKQIGQPAEFTIIVRRPGKPDLVQRATAGPPRAYVRFLEFDLP